MESMVGGGSLARCWVCQWCAGSLNSHLRPCQTSGNRGGSCRSSSKNKLCIWLLEWMTEVGPSGSHRNYICVAFWPQRLSCPRWHVSVGLTGDSEGTWGELWTRIWCFSFCSRIVRAMECQTGSTCLRCAWFDWKLARLRLCFTFELLKLLTESGLERWGIEASCLQQAEAFH